jgi:hypothetical protein
LKFLKKYYAVITGLLVFIVYITTLAPSVVEIDSGELAAVQCTLGIAHPTGYPLFTILGYLFHLLPLPFSKIYQLNLLTSIWCSLGVGLFVYTSKLVLDNINSFIPQKFIERTKTENKKKKGKQDQPNHNLSKFEIPEIKRYLAAVLGGLILAFSKTFWFQSTSVEVYSLQIFLFTLIILFLIKAYLYKNDFAKIKFINPWLVFAVILALGFSNHMTTLFVLPGVAYLYFDRNKFNKKSIYQIGLMLCVFIPVLILVYSYLPIRASQNPVLDWGNPNNLTRLLRHVEGDQYHVWLFSSTSAAEKQFSYFVLNLPNEFIVSLFICFIGLIAAFIKARKFFYFILITFLFTVLYAINYDIKDIDSYFILAYISLAFFAVFGIVQLLSLLKLKEHPYAISLSLITIFIAVQIYFNYDNVNQSDVYTFEDYTKSVLNYCSKNSVVFSYEWDYFVSPSYYFQYAEHYRSDVTVVDKELLRRSWYYHQLNEDHPKLLKNMKPDVNSFLQALIPFESGGNFNSNLLETYYRKIMTDLVATNIDKRNYYISPELFENEMQKGQFVLPKGYTLVPDLLMFKVVKGNQYVPAPDPNFVIRFPKKKNFYINFIESQAGSMLARRALYELQYDKIDRAKIYVKKIKKDFPDYALPEGLAEVLQK